MKFRTKLLLLNILSIVLLVVFIYGVVIINLRNSFHKNLNNFERELKDTSGNVASFATKIITDAIDMKASDIHIEPRLDCYTGRYRIDGILRRVLDLPQKVESSLIARFKVLSRMR